MISVFDGDDYLCGNLFYEGEKFIRDNNFDFCYAPYEIDNLDQIEIQKIPSSELEFTRSMIEMGANIASVGLVKREFWVTWDEKLNRYQDWDFWLQVTTKTTNGARLNKRLYVYRLYVKPIPHKHYLHGLAYIPKKHKLKDKNCELTLMIPFSREVYLHRFFNWLDNADMDRENIHLVFLDHTNSGYATWQFLKQEGKWASVRVLKIPWDRYLKPSKERWTVIAKNMNYGLKLIDTPYLAIVEDDTIPPLDAIPRMFETIKKDNCVFVEGVEVDRYEGTTIGAWDLLVREGIIIGTTKPIGKGLENITGGGFYCCMTKTDLAKKITFTDNLYGIPMGGDVNFVYELSLIGDCYIDWNIKCTHLSVTEDGSITEFYPKVTKPYGKMFTKEWFR